MRERKVEGERERGRVRERERESERKRRFLLQFLVKSPERRSGKQRKI